MSEGVNNDFKGPYKNDQDRQSYKSFFRKATSGTLDDTL